LTETQDSPTGLDVDDYGRGNPFHVLYTPLQCARSRWRHAVVDWCFEQGMELEEVLRFGMEVDRANFGSTDIWVDTEWEPREEGS
jgi:hypothetical protein